VAELDGSDYDEIILETPPSHVSHWLHVDLPERIKQLGGPAQNRDRDAVRRFHVRFTRRDHPEGHDGREAGLRG